MVAITNSIEISLGNFIVLVSDIVLVSTHYELVVGTAVHGHITRTRNDLILHKIKLEYERFEQL